jgi:ribosomally synthesized peptide (two-chain TOMM family)
MSGSWYDDFLQLRAAVVRAVAMAWVADHPTPSGQDPDPRQPFRKEFLDNPLTAMNEWFGYECPFDLDLTVQPSDPDDPPDIFAPAYTGGWVGIDNTIRLYLPPPPAEKEQWAEALAAYNQKRSMFLSYPDSEIDPKSA